jgi:sRNA-binding carbon storage regulator CsrA
MLMIGRRKHEEFFIGSDIKVKIMGIGVSQAKKGEPIFPITLDESLNDKLNFSVILGIQCPRELKIYRDVLYKDRY